MTHTLKNSFRQSILILAIVGFLMLAVAPTIVGAITLPGGGTGTSPSFATTQQVALNLINAALNKLNAAETVIQNNPTLSASTKTSILNDLNGIESQLLASKTKVEQATTSAELQAVYTEISGYLNANKDAIKNDFKIALTEIGASASAKAQAYKAQILQLLAVLKVTCPAQSSTITTLEGQLTQLESKIAALNSAVKAKDSAAIKTTMKDLNTLMKAMVANVKLIQTSCKIPTV